MLVFAVLSLHLYLKDVIWHLQRIQTLLLFSLHLLHVVFSEMGSVKKIDFASSQFRLFVGSRSLLHGSLFHRNLLLSSVCNLR